MLACKSKPIPVLPSLDKSAYLKKEVRSESQYLPYRLLLPDNYNKKKKYPLLIFLHGAGERGTDNELQLPHGAELFLDQQVRSKYPAFVVFPQCPIDSTWAFLNPRTPGSYTLDIYHEDGPLNQQQVLLRTLMKDLQSDYGIDSKRIYVGGLSMGGMGTFDLVRNNPETFAAAFSICGGAHPLIASKLKTPKWWLFHGEDDTVVPVEHSEAMHAALKKVGAETKLTLYPGVNHDSWTPALAEPDFLSWLFNQKLD